MADISQYLQAIMTAVYGEDVRGSIHDAIEIINDVGEVILSTGTAVTSASSSSTGYYEDSLYLNTDTYELWKCIGTDTWESQGILKGDTGAAGADGADGNRWYRGTGISGKAVNPTVYSGSGITDANPNDFYLNPSEGAVYHCVTGGDPTTATWSYDFTMTGGGGGGSVVGWNQIQTSTGATKIAEITIDGSKTDVYAPQGGGGSSTLSGLTDVNLTTPSNDQVLKYDSSSSKWVNGTAPQGGHTMIPNNTAISSLTSKATDSTDDDVASGYAIANWSNTECIALTISPNADFDTIGTWTDTWKTDGVRTGWLFHDCLKGILSDDDVEIRICNDISNEAVGSLYAYRIDDNYNNGGTYTGCMAIKFNNTLPSGTTVVVRLVRQRTQTIPVSTIS